MFFIKYSLSRWDRDGLRVYAIEFRQIARVSQPRIIPAAFAVSLISRRRIDIHQNVRCRTFATGNSREEYSNSRQKSTRLIVHHYARDFSSPFYALQRLNIHYEAFKNTRRCSMCWFSFGDSGTRRVSGRNRERAHGDVPSGEISPYAINPARRLAVDYINGVTPVILRAPDLAG